MNSGPVDPRPAAQNPHVEPFLHPPFKGPGRAVNRRHLCDSAGVLTPAADLTDRLDFEQHLRARNAAAVLPAGKELSASFQEAIIQRHCNGHKAELQAHVAGLALVADLGNKDVDPEAVPKTSYHWCRLCIPRLPTCPEPCQLSKNAKSSSSS